jgi:hypothetical protein
MCVLKIMGEGEEDRVGIGAPFFYFSQYSMV